MSDSWFPSSPQVGIVDFLKRFAFELAKWVFLLINHFRVDEKVNRYGSFIVDNKELMIVCLNQCFNTIMHLYLYVC